MESLWSYLGYDTTEVKPDSGTETTEVSDTEVDTDIRKIQVMERLVRAKLDRDDFLAKRRSIRKIQTVVRAKQAVTLLNELKHHRHYNRRLLTSEPDTRGDFEEQYQRKIRKLVKARARCFQDIRNIDAFLEREGTH